MGYSRQLRGEEIDSHQHLIQCMIRYQQRKCKITTELYIFTFFKYSKFIIADCATLKPTHTHVKLNMTYIIDQNWINNNFHKLCVQIWIILTTQQVQWITRPTHKETSSCQQIFYIKISCHLYTPVIGTLLSEY
ncbi:Hypothetical_protein [Hexamita inflata]|uniref:Hypothetical_protein n=1 Tax=Hexamita inflata TaxID=28002 RepID=A0AA86NH81_9EUKA|nr:Hypothetical protein HINF_LOCUS7404 [Hexamita inflata]